MNKDINKTLMALVPILRMNGENNGLVKDVIPHIKKGLAELVDHPEKYKKYEAPNGWGTIKGCKRFFNEVINEYEELPPELKEVSTFWIE